MENKTLGESRVRTDFNAAGSADVDAIKYDAAQLINRINALETKDGEAGRLKALAITAIEEGAMWAVKCATS